MTENEQSLIAGLKFLAAAEMDAPPPSLEAALLRQLKPKRILSWPLATELFAAAAVLAIAIYSRPAPAPNDGFIAVPYATPIAPYERTELVRVNVSVSALAQWGLPVSSPDPSQRVDADVVVGEDGLARAIRFIDKP